MMITGIRIKGKKPNCSQMRTLLMRLEKTAEKKGFVTNFNLKTATSIHISDNGKAFSIDTEKLGYNYRVNSNTIQSCKKGYKRTKSPTWDQRVQFNKMLNNILDSMKITCSVFSNGGNTGQGKFIIRTREERIDYWETPDNGFSNNEHSVMQIKGSETEAEQWLKNYYPKQPDTL